MKKFNLEEFFTFILFLGFSTLFYYLIFTGKINNFISPKMINYMIFALVIFTILTFYQGNKIFSPKNTRPISKSYLVLFLTIAIGFISAEKGINLSITNNKNINLPSYIKGDKVNNHDLNHKQDDEKNNLKDTLSLTDGKTVLIEESNYYKTVNDIGINLEKYKGKKVILTGFVFKREDFKEEQFVVGRMTMACCAADAEVMGLMATWSKSKSLEKDTWVKVEGIIKSIEHKSVDSDKGLILPLVEVTKLEKIDAPENIYVYP